MPRETFYLDGTKYNVFGLIVEEKQNNYKKFSCTLPNPSDALRTALGKGGHIYPDHFVKIVDRDKTSVIFEGFAEKVSDTTDGIDIIIEGRDDKVLLLDERTGRNDRWINQTGSTILTALLGYSTKVTLGTNTLTGTISGTVRFSHENLLAAFSSICAKNDRDFWMVRSGSSVTVNVGTQEVGSEVSPNRTLYVGKDLVSATREGAARDIINRQRVFGAGDGINQIQVCVPWIDINEPDTERSQGFDGYNADCLYAAATTSQTDVGIMEGKPITDKTIIDTDQAIATAKAILAASLGELSENVKVEVSRYIPGLQLGEWIRIIDWKKNIDVTQRIKRIKRNFDQDKMELDFYSPTDALEDMLASVQRESAIGNVTGIGATNLIELNFPDICDNTHPYEMIFQLPSEVEFIDRVKLSYIVSDYRAFTGVTAGGSPHKHGIKVRPPLDDSQIGMVGVQTYNLTNYLVANTALTQIDTAETESSHTHTIDYEISTQSASLTDVAILVDDGGGYVDRTAAIEAEIGTLSTTQELNIPIQDYLTANGGIKKIKIVPTGSNNGECRITGLLMVMFYMESA